jgi:hypothetical protein
MNRFRQSQRQHTKKPRRAVGLQVELLEARNLLSTPTNVLVNDPSTDTTARDTQSETAIVLGANSNVVVAYNDTGGAPPPHVWQEGGWSLSTNGGTSFTDEGTFPPAPSPYVAAVDPGLARSSKTGTIFLSGQCGSLAILNDSARVNIFRSTDNGATFNTPASGTPGFVDGVDRADKSWITVDNTPGPAGSGYGNVYLVWTDFQFKNNGSLIDNGIYFTRSTDDGRSWGPSGGVPLVTDKFGQGAFVTVGPDHTVYVFWWDGTNPSENIQMSKSTDLGQTFSAPVIVTGLRTNGGNGDLGLTYSNTNSSSFHSNAYPQAAVNPVTGDIYVVYDDKPKSAKDQADVFFTMSTDGGNTWISPLRVNDDVTTTDQWQPAIALTPDGTHLFITWYDRRNDPTNDSLIDRYGVIGTVSGHAVSFASNFRITDVSFPPAFGQDPFWVGVGGGGYMGDYDMATADNNYFYTTWGDNRLSDGFFANQPDVRLAKIPVEVEDSNTAVSTALTGGRILSGGTSTNLVSSAPTATPTRGTPTSPELGIFDAVSTANVLVGSLPTASLGLTQSTGPLSTANQASEASKTSEVLPVGSAIADDQQLPASPLVRHSVGADGLVTDFSGDLVADVIAGNLTMTLIR